MGGRRWELLLVGAVVAGCGRFGYDPTSGMCQGDSCADAAAAASDANPGAPDALAAPACDDIYGAADNYILCEQLPDRCSFNVNLHCTLTCDDACTSFGGTCLGAFDNANATGNECVIEGTDTCQTPRTTEICVCSR